jgi:hypothetical protein
LFLRILRRSCGVSGGTVDGARVVLTNRAFRRGFVQNGSLSVNVTGQEDRSIVAQWRAQ